MRYADFDFQDNVKISSFLNIMQEAAGISGNELGCGSKYLWPRKLGFIIASNYLEVYKSVQGDEVVTVKTWPLPPERIIFERHYEMYNKAGEKVAAATSRWCLIDVESRKLLSPSALDQDYSIYNPAKALEFKDWKIQRVSLDGLTPAYTVKAGNTDCDYYKHVNNTRYADFCFNCFTLEELNKLNVQSFQISYEEQCLEGDILNFYRIPVSENEFIIVGVKQENKSFMRAKIVFSNK